MDGTCVRDYIDVTDLVDAHVKALEKAKPNKVRIFNVGTGKGIKIDCRQKNLGSEVNKLLDNVVLLFCKQVAQ